MKSLDPSGSRSPGRFHTLGEVAKLLPPLYPCAGSFARINAASHFSRELPRSGLREESAAGRDRLFLHFSRGLSREHEPNGQRNTPVVQASQSCSTPRRKHKPRPPRARMAGREPRAKTRMKRKAASRSRHGLLDRHFIRKMRRILQLGRKLGISEQRLRELTVIAAGRIGKRLQQAMAKELLRGPRPAKQRPKQRL